MAPRRLSGGWHRRRPTARPLTVGVDVVQQPCDFRWTALPLLSSPAIPNGRRLTAQQPCDSPRRRFTAQQPFTPPSGCCRHYPAALRPSADAGIIVAGRTRGASIRATGALRLAAASPNSALPAACQTARDVFRSAWPWQLIAVVYSPRGLVQE